MGIDLEQPSSEHHTDNIRPNVNISLVDAGDEVYDKDRVAELSPSDAVNDKENTGPNVSERLSDGRHKVHVGDGVIVSSTNLEPHDGMDFESKEEAFSFYKEYAKSVGFATIIKASRRSRISGKFIDAKFVCTRYGSKLESITNETAEPTSNMDCATNIPVKKKRGRINRSWSKTDCKACMHVKRRQDGRWIIRSFIKEHNHEIFPDQAYYFRRHRNINLGNGDANDFNAIRARTRMMYVTMSRESSGCKKVEKLKGSLKDQFGNGRHLALEEGDAKLMLDHFMCMQDENPNFFYAIDLNEEQRLRNVFWIDAKGRLDYGNFCDAVFFDITYINNEYKLPFAPFIGVNHHFQFLLFGCALISDESKSTFVWLMRTWFRAMGGRAPRVILTDEHKFLKEAIAEVFPDSRHCFCLWHILSKIPEKLSYVMRQHENFMTKFNECIFRSWTGEQFETRWSKMVDTFDLRSDVWLESLYEDRQRWVPTYMSDTFLAGMSTKQRPESINTFFDRCIQRKTTLKEFLEQFKATLREKYEEEAKADFETWHKQPGLKSPSPFGKQMASLYTQTIFKKFQVEVLGVVACHPKKETENGATVAYKVQDFEENQEFIVAWNEVTSDISCLCRSFEYNGFLCRHVMIVLQMSGEHNIPSQYILKRWTKDAKGRQTTGEGSDIVESRVQRYKDLCYRAFKLGDEGSLSQETYNIAFNALEEALRKCERVNNSIQIVTEPSSLLPHGFHDFEEVNQGNSTPKANKGSISKKGKVHSDPEVITIGMRGSWQQMGHSNLQAAPPLDCCYETQESMQGMEQLSPRAPILDGYFGGQQTVEGMGQLNSIAPSRGEYYGNQHGLGQLNSIGPIHDGQYAAQQRIHGLGQLHFRPQSIQSCFDLGDALQEMESLHGLASKHLHHSKRTSR